MTENDEYDNAWDEKENGSEVIPDEATEEPEALEDAEVEKDDSPVDAPIPPPVVAPADVVTPEQVATWRGRVSASDKRNRELEDELKALKAKLEQQAAVKSPSEPEESEADVGDILPGFPEFNEPLRKRDSVIKTRIIEEVKTQTEDRINKVQAKVEEVIEPLRLEVIQREEQRRMETLNAVDPLWAEKAESPEFDAFIDSHPRYVADAMRQIKEKGSLEDAVSLLKQFNAYAERNNSVKNKRESQANAAAAVKSRPGSAVGRAGKDDYDSAFDEAPD